MIITERLDLYKLNTFIHRINYTEYVLYSRDFCGGRDYLLNTTHPHADYGDIDWVQIEIYPKSKKNYYQWAINVPYMGETKINFLDNLGSHDVVHNDDFLNRWENHYNALNPVYLEIVNLLINMGVNELSDKWYVKDTDKMLPMYFL